MSSPTSKEVESQSCAVEIDGHTITCGSLNDALLLKIGEHAVSHRMPPVDAIEALRIVRVLKKYGLYTFADAVARMSPPNFSENEE